MEIEFREVEQETKISTREGIVTAYPDRDYLIRGIEGELYPIKKDIFEDTYEVLETEAEDKHPMQKLFEDMTVVIGNE